MDRRVIGRTEPTGTLPGGRVELRFVTTAAASADARALSQPGLVRLDRVVDVTAIGVALLLVVLDLPIVGGIVLVIAVLSLLGSSLHPVQRALISARFGSMLGKETRVAFDDAGARFEGELGSTFVPWSSVTAVRTNRRTVALFRDRVLLGYVPASAFSSADQQADVVAFARSRIGAFA